MATTILVNTPDSNVSNVLMPLYIAEVLFTIDLFSRNIVYKSFLNRKEF